MRDVGVFGGADDVSAMKREILQKCPQLSAPLMKLEAADYVFDATNLLERDLGGLSFPEYLHKYYSERNCTLVYGAQALVSEAHRRERIQLLQKCAREDDSVTLIVVHVPLKRGNTMYTFARDADDFVKVTPTQRTSYPHVEFVGSNVARITTKDTSTDLKHAYRSFDDEFIKLGMMGHDLPDVWVRDDDGTMSYVVDERQHITGDGKYFADDFFQQAHEMFTTMGDVVRAEVYELKAQPQRSEPSPSTTPPTTPRAEKTAEVLPQTPPPRKTRDEVPGAPKAERPRPVSRTGHPLSIDFGERNELQEVKYLSDYARWSKHKNEDWKGLVDEIRGRTNGTTPCTYVLFVGKIEGWHLYQHGNSDRPVDDDMRLLRHMLHEHKVTKRLPVQGVFEFEGTWWVVRSFYSMREFRDVPNVANEPPFVREYADVTESVILYATPIAVAALTCLCVAQFNPAKMPNGHPAKPVVDLVKTLKTNASVETQNFVTDVLTGAVYDTFEMPTVKPTKTKTQKIKPNEGCPCGSGKKYKLCCGKAAQK